MNDDRNGFVLVTFPAVVADNVPVDEAAVVVSHCELDIFLGFYAVADLFKLPLPFLIMERLSWRSWGVQ